MDPVIPIEIFHYNIIHFLSSDILYKFSLIDKKSNKIVKNIYEEKAKVLKKNYRNLRPGIYYGTDLPFFLTYRRYLRFLEILNPKIMYRKMIIYVSDWYNIPEKIIRDTMHVDSSRYHLVNNWIENNISDINSRTKRDILQFFSENRITIREIMFSGLI